MPSTQPLSPEVSFGAALQVWAKIGLLSFGGPAGQVALMHQELVEERKWIDEERFLHALNYCMLLPGPEAQQLAADVGWLMHSARGGVAAGLLFVTLQSRPAGCRAHDCGLPGDVSLQAGAARDTRRVRPPRSGP